MTAFNYTIKDELGLHARPVGALVKLLKQYACEVTVTCGKRKANAKKMFELMGMAVKCGETVTVEISGDGEENLKQDLVRFFEENY